MDGQPSAARRREPRAGWTQTVEWAVAGPSRTPSITRTLLELTRAHRALSPDLRGPIIRGPYWTGGNQFDAGWMPGTSMIVRPSAARHVGPLREDLFLYGEDLSGCRRMARAGWGIGVCASTTFVHQREFERPRQLW